MIELFQTLFRAGRSIQVGGNTGHTSGPDWLRAAGLFGAAVVIGASLCLGAWTHGEYVASLHRLNARAVVPAQAGSDETPALLWREAKDTLRDGRRFRIVFITPLTSDAAPPPGVLKWPQAGEAWMSPALRKAGAAEGIEQRYGRTVGTIDRYGLTGPSELLAYVRPPQDLSAEQALPVVGFGGPHLWVNRQYPDRELNWVLHPALLGAMLLSGLGLLFVAARLRSPALDRQAAVVATLGGRWVHRAALVAGQGWQLTLYGCGAGWVIALFAAKFEGMGPVRRHASDDDTGNLYLFALVVVTVLLSGVATLVLTTLFGGPPRRHPPGLPRTGPAGWSRAVVWLVAAACPVMVLFTWYGPALLPATVPQPVGYWTGVVGTALTLPAVVALVTAVLARLWAYQGRVRGRAAHLVGGRQVAAHPGAVAWMVAAMTIGVCLAWQIPIWQAVPDAETQRDRLQSSVVEVAPRGGVTESQLDSFLAGLPSGTRAVVKRPGSGKVASDRELSRALAQDPRARLVLSVPDGHELSIPDLKRLAHRLLPLGAAVEHPGSGLPSAAPYGDGDRWPIYLVAALIVVLAAATGLAAAGRFLNRARFLAPLTVYGDTSSVLRSSATWWVLVPLTLAALAGTGMAALLAVPMGVVSALPVGLMLTWIGVIFLLGFVITEWVTLLAIHETGPQRGVASRDGGSGGKRPAQRRTGKPARTFRISFSWWDT